MTRLLWLRQTEHSQVGQLFDQTPGSSKSRSNARAIGVGSGLLQGNNLDTSGHGEAFEAGTARKNFHQNLRDSRPVELPVLFAVADSGANDMASTTNPFTDARPKRAAIRCHALLNWPRERLPQLWQRFISDIRGPAKPSCPDCGRPMILRKVKYGREAGKEFWDCSNFLRCSRKLDSNTAMVRMNKSPFGA